MRTLPCPAWETMTLTRGRTSWGDVLEDHCVVEYGQIAKFRAAGGQQEQVRTPTERLEGSFDPRPLVPRRRAGEADKHQRTTVLGCDGGCQAEADPARSNTGPT